MKLSLAGRGVLRVAYSIAIGEVPGIAQRQRADVDGDGVIDPAELARHALGLQAVVGEGLVIEVDGERRAIAWDAPRTELKDARVGPLPFTVDLVGRVSVARCGACLVRVDDRSPLEDLGETEIGIDEGPGTRVLAAWSGAIEGGRVLRFVWNGPRAAEGEERSIRFRFVDDSVAPARWWTAPLAGVLAIVGAAAAWLVFRMRSG